MHASFLHDTLYPVLFIINKFANICIPSLIHAPSQGHTVMILVLCVRAFAKMRSCVMTQKQSQQKIITHCKYESSKQ